MRRIYLIFLLLFLVSNNAFGANLTEECFRAKRDRLIEILNNFRFKEVISLVRKVEPIFLDGNKPSNHESEINFSKEGALFVNSISGANSPVLEQYYRNHLRSLGFDLIPNEQVTEIRVYHEDGKVSELPARGYVIYHDGIGYLRYLVGEFQFMHPIVVFENQKTQRAQDAAYGLEIRPRMKREDQKRRLAEEALTKQEQRRELERIRARHKKGLDPVAKHDDED